MNFKYFYPLLILLFILNPFITTVLLLLLSYFLEILKSPNKFNLIIVFLAITLSLINITKIPESDLLFHTNSYLKAANYNIVKYLLFFGKEPIFFIYNYLFFYLSGGSITYWVLTFSFISYFLFFKAILKYYKYIGSFNSQLIFALVLAAFFPQLFSLSAHLIRQFVAASIIIYFAIDKIFYNKNRWWLGVIAILIHTSSVIFLPLIYFKNLGFLKKRIFSNLIIIIGIVSYQIIAAKLYNSFNDSNIFVNYALARAQRDNNFELGGFKILNYIMVLCLIIIYFIYTFYHKKRKNIIEKSYSRSKYYYFILQRQLNKDKIRHFFSIMIFLFILIIINLYQTELSVRLFFYIFFFFPFITPLIFNSWTQINQIIMFTITILFFMFFVYRLEFGTWTYAPIKELLTNSLFSYFTI